MCAEADLETNPPAPCGGKRWACTGLNNAPWPAAANRTDDLPLGISGFC